MINVSMSPLFLLCFPVLCCVYFCCIFLLCFPLVYSCCVFLLCVPVVCVPVVCIPLVCSHCVYSCCVFLLCFHVCIPLVFSCVYSCCDITDYLCIIYAPLLLSSYFYLFFFIILGCIVHPCFVVSALLCFDFINYFIYCIFINCVRKLFLLCGDHNITSLSNESEHPPRPFFSLSFPPLHCVSLFKSLIHSDITCTYMTVFSVH